MDIPQLLPAWPPLFTLKKSLRARHVKLKASVTHGLQLIVPKRFNQKHIPLILEENRSWIETQLAKIALELQTILPQALPDTISLPAVNQVWKIIYASNTNKKVRIVPRANQELVLLGNIEDKNLCKKMLIKWVKDQAKKHLTKRLAELSEHTGLHYSNLTIRNQTTRWGSCSSVKAISLNYKLIFLAPEITDYIIIHELCHTVHMNHSARFWRLVSQWDAGWKEHSRAARRADKLIPAWATEFYVAN